MEDCKAMYYEKRAQKLVANLKSRHFDAWYCPDCKSALKKALELIPEGASVGWGGAMSADQIGLTEAVCKGNYQPLDRSTCTDAAQREQMAHRCLNADYFITGANALSLDGEMVNIDGNGNRVAAIVYGPRKVLVIVGMNKVCDDLDSAVLRARTVAAPMNQQRFQLDNPCTHTGICADCKSPTCICNQILVTRHCRPQGRIQFIIVGQELGL